jgi:hypothetical protein
MEPEVSLLCLQESATDPCSETQLFRIHFNIMLPYIPRWGCRNCNMAVLRGSDELVWAYGINISELHSGGAAFE